MIRTQSVRRGRLALGLAVLATAGAALAPSGVHAEATGPVAGCGAGWQLVTIAGAVDLAFGATTSIQEYRVATGWKVATTEVVEDFDALRDDDGWVCARLEPSSPGRDKQWCVGIEGCVDYRVMNVNDNTAVGRLSI